jgi:hypothetical protein
VEPRRTKVTNREIANSIVAPLAEAVMLGASGKWLFEKITAALDAKDSARGEGDGWDKAIKIVRSYSREGHIEATWNGSDREHDASVAEADTPLVNGIIAALESARADAEKGISDA